MFPISAGAGGLASPAGGAALGNSIQPEHSPIQMQGGENRHWGEKSPISGDREESGAPSCEMRAGHAPTRFSQETGPGEGASDWKIG
mgnify:CR=1 FL=1